MAPALGEDPQPEGSPAERIKPWCYHTWQHPIDPNFLALVAPVLRLYKQAIALLKQGIWVVCADEKTSIQAREGIHLPDPAVSGEPVHVAPRCKRRGALRLFAALGLGSRALQRRLLTAARQ